MFVSSYNTYITTNNSQRTEKERDDKTKPSQVAFDSKLSKESASELKGTLNPPINYISEYKVSSNKQKMQEEVQNKDKAKFTEINSMNSAKVAYEDNSKMFSFLLEPKATQSQTPRISKRLPSDMQIAQEQNMRQTMINAYQENDKYYQITAA